MEPRSSDLGVGGLSIINGGKPMNKKLLAAIMAVTMATTVNAEVDVYGKFNLSLQSADRAGASVFEVKNNSSRIGFKGSEDVEGGLTAVYQYELGIDPDDKDTWTQRNAFLGVKGDFGFVRAGVFDTAFKTSQGKVDVFGDLEGDMGSALTPNDNRMSNSVAYTTPSMGAMSASVHYIASEEDGEDSGVSASATYKADALYVSVGYDNGVEETDSTGLRLTAVYNFSNLQLGGLYETFEPAEGDSANAVLISAKYKIDATTLKFQYGESDIKEMGATTLSVGVDYTVSKSLSLLSYISQEESDEVLDDTFIGVGAVLKF